MLSSDFFFYIVGIAFAVLVGFMSWTCYRTVKTLDKIDNIIADIKGVTADIDIFRSGLKMGLSTLISAVVARLRLPADKSKGGDK
jgi:hypothetical protein